MRHRYSGRKLNRTSSHRTAMFRNMTASLVEHELIKTTLPKAKELRRFAEPLITLSKKDSVANRRLAFSRLRNKVAVGKLFAELGPRYQERPGGYTRILKCGTRAGDNAPMAYVELVDREIMVAEDDFIEEEGGESSRDIVLMRPQREIEADVKKVINEIPEITGITHIYCHYLNQNLSVQVNIMLDTEMRISDAQIIASIARTKIEQIKDIDDADLHLELDDAPEMVQKEV